MPKYILMTQREDRHEQIEAPQFVGCFELHSQANKEMQRRFDLYAQTSENFVETDDSDAGHFYIAGDDAILHWWVLEMEVPVESV